MSSSSAAAAAAANKTRFDTRTEALSDYVQRYMTDFKIEKTMKDKLILVDAQGEKHSLDIENATKLYTDGKFGANKTSVSKTKLVKYSPSKTPTKSPTKANPIAPHAPPAHAPANPIAPVTPAPSANPAPQSETEAERQDRLYATLSPEEKAKFDDVASEWGSDVAFNLQFDANDDSKNTHFEEDVKAKREQEQKEKEEEEEDKPVTVEDMLISQNQELAFLNDKLQLITEQGDKNSTDQIKTMTDVKRSILDGMKAMKTNITSVDPEKGVALVKATIQKMQDGKIRDGDSAELELSLKKLAAAKSPAAKKKLLKEALESAYSAIEYQSKMKELGAVPTELKPTLGDRSASLASMRGVLKTRKPLVFS